MNFESQTECHECENKSVYKDVLRVMPGNGETLQKEGVFHMHSESVTVYGYECENGHSMELRMKQECPAKECEFNDDLFKVFAEIPKPQQTIVQYPTPPDEGE